MAEIALIEASVPAFDVVVVRGMLLVYGIHAAFGLLHRRVGEEEEEQNVPNVEMKFPRVLSV